MPALALPAHAPLRTDARQFGLNNFAGVLTSTALRGGGDQAKVSLRPRPSARLLRVRSLDILLQRHRDTDAAKTFLTRLLGEYAVPEVIHTDQLRSYGAAIQEIPSLVNLDHQQVMSDARCNNILEQEHRSTRRHERSQQGFKRRKRAQEFLGLHARIENLHHHSRTTVSASTRRNNQKQAFQTWVMVVVGVA
ncbi:DDE domain-containing protein [Deinococcus sp. Arct2-2]|nr:DDE domain-containing protein [Deinococcus sp. Arct2-2]